MENNFEKQLKEIIKNSEDIKVPSKISVGIDEVLENLKPKNKKKNLLKRVSIAAVLVLAILAGFVATFPTLAAEIPIINKFVGDSSLFNTVKSSKYSDEFKNLSKLNNVSVGINKGVYDKGITITIKEIAYDEAAFYVIYEVNFDKNLKNKNLENCSEVVEINGKRCVANAIVPLYSDDTKVAFTEVFPVLGGDVMPDKFDFNISFTKVSDIEGNWNFKIPLIKQNLKDKVNIFGLNKYIVDGFNVIKLAKVTSSPAYLSLLTEHGVYKADKYDYVLMDSKGNEFQQVDIGGIAKKALSTDVTFFYKQIEGSKLDSIKILKPKVEKYSPNKLKNVQYIALNSKLPVDVSVGKNKKLTVNSISEKDNQIEIIFSSEKVPVYTFGFGGGISIYDKTMSKESRDAYDIVRPEVLGNNKYKVTIPKKRSLTKDDKVVEYDRDIKNLVICIGNYDEMYKEVGYVDLKMKNSARLDEKNSTEIKVK